MRGLTAALFLLTFFTLSCAVPAAPAASYFPLVPGATWIRKADDGGQIAARVTTRRTVGSVQCTVVETKTVRDGRELVTRVCYEATPTQIRVIETETAGRTTVLDPPRVLLVLPPRPGTSWSWHPKDSPVPASLTEEWIGEDTVKVAAGTFRAWKVKSVTKRADLTVTLFTWYALGVGIVKIERTEQRGQLQREGGSELASYKIP